MQRHVDAVRAALLDSIPYGVDVQKVDHDASMRPPGMPPLPPGHVRIEAHFTGWGPMFESWRMRLHAEVDLARPPASAALRWMDRIDRTLRHQTDMAERAEAAGVHAPIDLRGIFPTGHLLIDRAALGALIALENDPRCWIHQQIEFARVERLEDGGETPMVTIHGATLSIPFLFEPLRIGRGYGRSSALPLWTGDRLILGEPLPDTVCAALVGQPVSRLVPGTPVDGRTITAADTVRAVGQEITTVVFESDLVRLVDTLPAREM
jgi:hypothetical protein